MAEKDELETLRYPVGRFVPQGRLEDVARRARIAELAAAPGELRRAVEGLTGEQLDTPYRPGGWTVRQLVHHVADSHLNAYVRVRWLLTEDTPAIKTYDQEAWAELADARSAGPELSLALLEALHRRWVALLEALPAAAFARAASHPEWGAITLDDLLAQYAWHGRHHVAHATGLRRREGW